MGKEIINYITFLILVVICFQIVSGTIFKPPRLK